MPRFFLEVSYKGTNYHGFQIQPNAHTIQSEVERAMEIFFREKITLTGSSRTDAGVHALQNFFHFDYHENIDAKYLYNINSLLPHDIAAINLFAVAPNAHCRYNAISREYKYFIYNKKNPFLFDRAYFYPYKINIEVLNGMANVIQRYHDFTSFSKRNTQAKNFLCNISHAQWYYEKDCLVFQIIANRFLRGMVRGLTATMLLSSHNNNAIEQLQTIVENKNCTSANFSVPAKGLFLIQVNYA